MACSGARSSRPPVSGNLSCVDWNAAAGLLMISTDMCVAVQVLEPALFADPVHHHEADLLDFDREVGIDRHAALPFRRLRTNHKCYLLHRVDGVAQCGKGARRTHTRQKLALARAPGAW